MLIMTYVDTLTGEQVPYIIEKFMSIGASNVHAVPAFTKKGRPEYIFFIDAPEEKLDIVKEAVVKETGSLGMRILKEEHFSFPYEIRKMRIKFTDQAGEVIWESKIAIKVTTGTNGRIISARAEHEEVVILIQQLREKSLDYNYKDLKKIIENEALLYISRDKFHPKIIIEDL